MSSSESGPRGAGRVLDPTTAAAEVASVVADRLDSVERMFRENLASPLEIIDEIGEFVAGGGGKRVRPILHLLSARMCGYRGQDDVILATVLEFIHSATLIHDDIIDEATTRRGRPAANYRWGNNITVLFGDYLYAKAMSMALRVGSLTVMEKLADVTLRMTEGEMLQTRYEGRIDLSEEEYLGLIERKTAALFGACCELAAILARVDESQRLALRQSGVQLGIAFQLVDDLLDFTGDAKVLGKPAATDLREGKVTLSLIDLLGSGSRRARELAQRIMDVGEPDMPEIVELTALLEESGAIERTRRRARDYAVRATAGLDLFPDGPSRRALQSVADLLVFRER